MNFKEKTRHEQAVVVDLLLRDQQRQGLTWHEICQLISYYGYGDVLTIDACVEKVREDDTRTWHDCFHEVDRELFKRIRSYAKKHPDEFRWVPMEEDRYFIADTPARLHYLWRSYLGHVGGSVRNFLGIAKVLEERFPKPMRFLARVVRWHAERLLEVIEMSVREADLMEEEEDED